MCVCVTIERQKSRDEGDEKIEGVNVCVCDDRKTEKQGEYVRVCVCVNDRETSSGGGVCVRVCVLCER